MEKIGILGSGEVAKYLSNGFLKHGYHVMLGSRDLTKLKEWKDSAGDKGFIGSFADAAEFGDIIVLAIKGSNAADAIRLAGAAHFKGKTVIDPTNPIDSNTPPVNGVLKYYTSLDNSLMEQLQSEFPEANFVKAFNIIGSPFMVNPDFGGIKPTMFICGNNDKAKEEVSHILDLFGFEVSDMGSVVSARAIEPLCILWCIPGMLRNEWTHAFKFL